MEKYSQICEVSKSFDANDDLSRGKHIGLANIKWRLNYLLGKKQSLTIIPREPRGTIVTIVLDID